MNKTFMLLPLGLLLSGLLGAGIVCVYAYGSETDPAFPKRLTSEERVAIEGQGFLGITTSATNRKNGFGVLATSVEPGSPAEKAGIQKNDIILEVNGQAVGGVEGFTHFLNQTKAGQGLTFVISRGGKKKKIIVMLSKLLPSLVQKKLKESLGQSLRDQAEEALSKKDLDRAISCYEQWLKADPQDYRIWYNLACAYARTGEKEKALEAWECAVDAGWDDPEHPKQDQDLKSLWPEERFKKGLERCASNQTLAGPAGFKRNIIPMTSLGTYIVMLPPDYETAKKKYPLCLILHGHGSTELGHGKLADKLGREGVIYLAPRSAYSYTEDFPDQPQPGWTAWPPYPSGEIESSLKTVDELNVDWIFACAADAKKRYRVEGNEVFIIGHSQGAFLADVCAALHPELVKSFFAYAGFYPDVYLGKGFLDEIKKRNVTVYLAHCTEDRVVDPVESRKLEKAMKEVGVRCTLKMFKGEHRLTDDVFSYAREWLNTEVRAGGVSEK